MVGGQVHASDSNLGHDRVVPRVCGCAKQRSAKRGANQDGVQAISVGTKQLHLVRRDANQRNGLPCREADADFTGASAKVSDACGSTRIRASRGHGLFLPHL